MCTFTVILISTLDTVFICHQTIKYAKHFHCLGCGGGGQHKRPIGVKYHYKDSDVNISSASSVNES